MIASFLAGAVGSAVTNAFDVLTINKQAMPETSLLELIKKERHNLLTKGLLARVFLNSLHSIFFFTLIMYIGKVYNVELSES